MVLMSATSLRGALERVGIENLDVAPRNDVALLKTNMYCAKKTSGTLIVIKTLNVRTNIYLNGFRPPRLLARSRCLALEEELSTRDVTST
jgi:hypothetical protein